MAWSIRDAVRAPGDWMNYLQVAWSLLLVAWPIGQFVGSTARVTGLIIITGNLAGLVVFIGNTVRAPGLGALLYGSVAVPPCGVVAHPAMGPRGQAQCGACWRDDRFLISTGWGHRLGPGAARHPRRWSRVLKLEQPWWGARGSNPEPTD
jgi:hypothetical protein